MTPPTLRIGAAAIAAVALGLPAAFTAPTGVSFADTAVPASQVDGRQDGGKLELGAPDLPETRTVTTLAPGLTRTSITRGAPDAALFWTAEVAIPSTSADPDAPASALSDAATAQAVALKLRDAGVQARVEHVQSPQLADAGGDLGYRVRAGAFESKDAGTATISQLKAAGYAASALYTGWDGDAGTAGTTRGPWKLEVLTLDPKIFRGELTSGFGPDLQDRETTSQLATAETALAGVNGGYFVLDPRAGAPGDPAGTAVVGGKLLSEPVADRPSLVIDGKKNESSIKRLTWSGRISSPGHGTPLALDGLNRVPGLIRNCGGTGDLPTNLPLHDATCTDPDETVAFSGEFGPSTPSGPGLEVILDQHGTVTAVNNARGAAVPAAGSTVQATGADVAKLKEVAILGKRLDVESDLSNEAGKAEKTGGATSVVNGGPMLVSGGVENITARRDGMVHADDNNSFYYGWVHKRNPRTIAGVDAQGRTLLVTADGRQTTSLGLSIKEAADVARSLGMVDAINLDGGGSTTMVVAGQVVNSPSDAAGQRPVGDALLVLPRRKN
ncbi:phosphodiester glycosidase family protein [Arthrobacter sp. H16F315]|uniref:phosphodiester glycosidase family protein n=1 Tax=Arthrobacter sp. H16F315 TaxID=2955314 RepID=UPI002097B61D|nr:phosphodiester glycosidase family protein [Arthrobacter sp. H16F315]MDD1477427.1 phosphodiester glycosidase family protein [Arthrobacter sp. H16F315]